MTDEEQPVLAAGCVLWRRSPADGGLELCVVHRPKYDDWSHPKGKLNPGEDALAGALREVEEETGYTAAPGPELPTVHYLTGGRPKQVRYWAAEAVSGGFTELGGGPHPVAAARGGPRPPHPAARPRTGGRTPDGAAPPEPLVGTPRVPGRVGARLTARPAGGPPPSTAAPRDAERPLLDHGGPVLHLFPTGDETLLLRHADNVTHPR
jgi:8-oxo-dGTP diphosphatase